MMLLLRMKAMKQMTHQFEGTEGGGREINKYFSL